MWTATPLLKSTFLSLALLLGTSSTKGAISRFLIFKKQFHECVHAVTLFCVYHLFVYVLVFWSLMIQRSLSYYIIGSWQNQGFVLLSPHIKHRYALPKLKLSYTLFWILSKLYRFVNQENWQVDPPTDHYFPYWSAVINFVRNLALIGFLSFQIPNLDHRWVALNLHSVRYKTNSKIQTFVVTLTVSDTLLLENPWNVSKA